MHELSICHGVVQVCEEVLRGLPPPTPRVSHVTVRVGRLTAVVPESLRYHFDILAPGTLLDGAALVVEDVPIRGRCGDCAIGFEIGTLSFTCPRCGSGLVELTSGRELEVVSLDTDEGVACAR